jgi:leader peptidase (prepilin peptidase)/N-methyltransferase
MSGPNVLVALPFTAVLIAGAAIDLRHRVVPNRLLLPAALWAVGMGITARPGELVELLVAGIGAFLPLVLVALAHPPGMGMGDAKLAGVMGLYLGASVIPALALACLGGSLYGLWRIAREGAGARKAAVPFAPFLALGGLASLIAGADLLQLYAQRLL